MIYTFLNIIKRERKAKQQICTARIVNAKYNNLI